MCNYLNKYTNSNDAHYFRYTSFMKNVQKMYSLGIDHLTWKGGGDYGFLFRSEFFFRTTRELEY
jgi:hypothetical protein